MRKYLSIITFYYNTQLSNNIKRKCIDKQTLLRYNYYEVEIFVLFGGDFTVLSRWFEKNPNLLEEWDFLANANISIESIGHTSKRKAFWTCRNSHKWEAMIFSRTILNRGCPYCASQKVLAEFNDLATTRADVLSRWDFDKNTDISPTEVTAASHKYAWWKCERGHSWQQKICVITGDKNIKSGCPYCYGRKVEKGFNDLLFLEPDIAKEWCYELNELKPDEVTVGSKKSVWWKCEEGHTWKVPPFSRTGISKTKCPYCTGFKAWAGFNDLATVNPSLASEWDENFNGALKPTDVTKGSHKKVWWKCSAGHVWEARVYSRARENGTGCPVCNKSTKNKKR